MNQPQSRGAQISPQRIARWVNAFRFYRHPPDDQAIQQWLERFRDADRDTAARVLDCVQVVSEQQVLMGYRDALSLLAGWNIDPARRKGRWYFVGFGSSGESGAAMLRLFREANRLTSAQYNDIFCSASDLPSKQLTAGDHVVFVDDFSGTGRQVCVAWPTMQELIASDASCYLILTAATKKAISKIDQLINLTVEVQFILGEEDNIFSSRCIYFTSSEKLILEKYGKKADNKNPRGFGGCGLLLVLSHKTPNNTIPILHAYHNTWRGLFPRYLPLPN